MKLYTSVIRQQDGTWARDPMPTSLREAKKSAQFNRCMAGTMTQIMPANEDEIKNWKDAHEDAYAQRKVNRLRAFAESGLNVGLGVDP